MSETQIEDVTPEEIALRRAGFVLRDRGPTGGGDGDWRTTDIVRMRDDVTAGRSVGTRADAARMAMDYVSAAEE